MYSLNKVRPHIWHVEMDCRYELGMTFLRASEYYESKNYEFRRTLYWTILEQMKWYSTNEASPRHGKYGSFSFTSDWGGYNVPSDVFDVLYPANRFAPIKDWNAYDARMRDILDAIRSEEKHSQYYVIGVQAKSPKGALGHELAHGYYYTDDDYRHHMNSLVRSGKHQRAVNLLKLALIDVGYCDDVLDDEVQAYCATGFCGVFAPLLEEKDLQTLVAEIGQIFAAQEKKYNG